MKYNFEVESAERFLKEIEKETVICVFSFGFFTENKENKRFEGIKDENGFSVYNKDILHNVFNPKFKISKDGEKAIRVKLTPNIVSLMFAIMFSLVSSVLLTVMLVTEHYLYTVIFFLLLIFPWILIFFYMERIRERTNKIFIEMKKSHDY